MELMIKQQTVNGLLKRTEISGSIKFEKVTPSNQDLVTALAEKLKKEVGLFVIKNIYTKFGQHEADFTGVFYEDMEAKSKFEKMTKHLRKKLEADKKKAEEEAAKKVEEAKAAAEAKKVEEAPVEEPKKEEAPVAEPNEEVSA